MVLLGRLRLFAELVSRGDPVFTGPLTETGTGVAAVSGEEGISIISSSLTLWLTANVSLAAARPRASAR